MIHKSEIRYKVLNGTLERDEVDNSDLYDFLQLLKSKDYQNKYTKEFNEITIEDWRAVVAKCKSKSMLSVFSKCTYMVYKIIARNNRFMYVLLLFYNLVLKKRIVLNRWRNILDVILEKGKGLVLGKLRIIELIERDL